MCPEKQRHETRSAALKVRAKILEKKPDEYLRSYECSYCGGWHLTSQPKHDEARTTDEILDEMRDSKVTVERPWTRWDRFVYWLTGRVSERVFAERMAGIAIDEKRSARLAAELQMARKREERAAAATSKEETR